MRDLGTVRPPLGAEVFWRMKGEAGNTYGYVTYVYYTPGREFIRMGRWKFDTVRGPVVLVSDIEWEPYQP